jgi:hypothetical protein
MDANRLPVARGDEAAAFVGGVALGVLDDQVEQRTRDPQGLTRTGSSSSSWLVLVVSESLNSRMPEPMD